MLEKFNDALKPSEKAPAVVKDATSAPTNNLPKSRGGDVGITDPVTGQRMFGT
jgi:hypothetical protein